METEEEFDSLVPLFASSARPIESKKRSSSSTTSPSSPGPSVWHRAAAKGRTVADPWASFEIERTCETEKALRYQYDARKRHWTTDEITIKMQSKSFACGAMRECFRMKKLSAFVHHNDWKHAANYVAKSYKQPVERRVYFSDIQLQMDAKLWAEEFNKHGPPKKVDIFQTFLIELVDRSEKPLYCVERLIEGDYIKYNSNTGFVSAEQRYTPQAFSHFTFERSGHKLIVVDIQGVGDLYTDPQIHTEDGLQYGEANLGVKGMALFFYSHRCNPICESLGLTPFDLRDDELASVDVAIGSSLTSVSTKSADQVFPIDDIERLGAPEPSPKLNSVLTTYPVSILPCESDSDTGTKSHEDAFELKKRKMTPAKILPRAMNEDEEIGEESSLLGQIHFALAVYHDLGRFSVGEPMIDNGLFHLQKAAEAGVMKAALLLAKIYLQFPHDELSSFRVDSSKDNETKGIEMMERAARVGDKEAAIYTAKHYDGMGPSQSDTALKWYKRATTCSATENDDSSSAGQDCQLLARMAEIHMSKDEYQEAGDLYTEAAEMATEAMKGKLASKYYCLAEEAWGNIED